MGGVMGKLPKRLSRAGADCNQDTDPCGFSSGAEGGRNKPPGPRGCKKVIGMGRQGAGVVDAQPPAALSGREEPCSK